MSENKIIAVVKFNEGHAYVLEKNPEFVYEKHGGLLIGTDETETFYNVLFYEVPFEQFKAFGGREFELPLKGGGVEKCNGQWWDGKAHKAAEILNKNFVHVTFESKESLEKCYVYSGCYADEEKLQKLVSEYDGRVYGYREYESLLKGEKQVTEVLDELGLRKAAREMVSAKVWQAWKNAGIDVVSVEGKNYFGSDSDKEKAEEIEKVIVESGKSTDYISSQNRYNNFGNCFWNKVTNQKMIDLERENAELRKARPVLPIPAAKFVSKNTIFVQVAHVMEEIGEVARALKEGDSEGVNMELGDVICACFTALEINGCDEAARNEFFRRINEKNEIRGYFETEDVAK